MMRNSAGIFLALGLLLSASGCGGSSGSFPTITPPIQAVTPAGLKNSGFSGLRPALTGGLSITQFKTDFFGTGPTVLFNITNSVDGRISFFNNNSTKSGCLSATPVAYTITPAGQASPVTMYAQCYTTIPSGFTGDPGLILIGKNNGVTYIWDANGAAWVAAIATPDGGSYDIHAWYSVGIGNGKSGSNGGQCGNAGAFDDCSYGVAEIYTNAGTGAFEMAAAGIGVGYCGVQLASDGMNTYADGSAGPVCAATDDLCVLSSDETTVVGGRGGICTPGGSAAFTHTTAIGIETGSGPTTSWGNSPYPTVPNVVLNGTSTDSVHFGPTTPPAGVAQF
jgi:hypothetical protein